MFADQPVCLILDEFQTWYSGLPDTDPKTGLKIQANAFNFIQNLSEIARDRPEILILAISVRDTVNDAYQQVHRLNPEIINFQGANAKRDRLNLILHRLFANRAQIPPGDIERLTVAHAEERIRLLAPGKTGPERDGARREGSESWPFSPELIALLDDHILMSANAQNTRDLIKILAQAFKSRGGRTPVISPADFFVDGDEADQEAAQILINAIAVYGGLLAIAQRNLQAVRDAGAAVTHDREMVSAIWMYSLSLGLEPGVSAPRLQAVVTKEHALDDNAFQAGLARLVENSMNLHGGEAADGRLRFETRENPRSKVKAYARNGKLWDPAAAPAAGTAASYPGKDVEHIRRTLKHLFTPDSRESISRIVVLGPAWREDPWSEAEEADKPDAWDRPVLLVVPEKFSADPAELNAILGGWLARQASTRRNTVRFLIQAAGAENLFQDQALIFQARCGYLCAKNAWGQDRTYASLANEFDRQLRDSLRGRFNRFALLHQWDYQEAGNCLFDLEKLTVQGGDIPGKVEERIRVDLFDPMKFRDLALTYAKNNRLFGELLDELAEAPPLGTGEAIPFVGESHFFELTAELAAKGVLALNADGAWLVRRPEDASDEDACRRISRSFRSQSENRRIRLGLPEAAGGGALPAEPASSPSGVTPLPPRTACGGYPDAGPAPAPAPISFPPIKETQVKKTAAAASGLNLSGCFETWGLGQQQRIEQARLEFAGLSVYEIRRILQSLPPACKANLEITYREEGGA